MADISVAAFAGAEVQVIPLFVAHFFDFGVACFQHTQNGAAHQAGKITIQKGKLEKTCCIQAPQHIAAQRLIRGLWADLVYFCKKSGVRNLLQLFIAKIPVSPVHIAAKLPAAGQCFAFFGRRRRNSVPESNKMIGGDRQQIRLAQEIPHGKFQRIGGSCQLPCAFCSFLFCKIRFWHGINTAFLRIIFSW